MVQGAGWEGILCFRGGMHAGVVAVVCEGEGALAGARGSEQLTERAADCPCGGVQGS